VEAEAPDRLEIVPLEEVPPGALLPLLDACLGARPGAGSEPAERGEEFWRWKHERNPFGRSPGLVALHAGEPVALRAFLRWRWRVDGRDLEAVRAVDTATHPVWRRRGLFRRLTTELVERLRAEGTALVFNTPNPKSRAGYLAMGWHDVGRVPLLVRPRRPGRLLKAALAGLGRRGGIPSTGSDAPIDPGAGSSLRPVGELLEAPALPGLLASRRAMPGRLETARSPDYLRWRYAEAPGVRYLADWSLDRGSDPSPDGVAGAGGAAIVVRSRVRRGLRELTLAEILVSDDPAGRAAAAGLIGRLVRSAEADYVAALATPGSPERAVLRSAGFLPLPPSAGRGGPRLVVRPLAPIAPDPRNPAAWRLSVGDLELF
jgi:GNAT superfamily N-acetyltransferase